MPLGEEQLESRHQTASDRRLIPAPGCGLHLSVLSFDGQPA